MSSAGNPRRNTRKRNPPATRRRALELLADSFEGCTRPRCWRAGSGGD